MLQDFNYFGIDVHIAYNSHLGAVWRHDGLQINGLNGLNDQI